MAEYRTINAKLSNSKLNKLKSAVKNKQGTTMPKCLVQIIYLMSCY